MWEVQSEYFTPPLNILHILLPFNIPIPFNAPSPSTSPFPSTLRSLLSPWYSTWNPAGVLEFHWTDHGIWHSSRICTEYNGNYVMSCDSIQSPPWNCEKNPWTVWWISMGQVWDHHMRSFACDFMCVMLLSQFMTWVSLQPPSPPPCDATTTQLVLPSRWSDFKVTSTGFEITPLCVSSSYQGESMWICDGHQKWPEKEGWCTWKSMSSRICSHDSTLSLLPLPPFPTPCQNNHNSHHYYVPECMVPFGYRCSPCTSLCSSVQAKKLVLSNTTGSRASRGSESAEVLIQEKPSQFCQWSHDAWRRLSTLSQDKSWINHRGCIWQTL